jgi:hypothetical protein
MKRFLRKSNSHTFGDTINVYTEREFCISGMFLYAQRLIEDTQDKEALRILAMLCAKTFERTINSL